MNRVMELAILFYDTYSSYFSVIFFTFFVFATCIVLANLWQGIKYRTLYSQHKELETNFKHSNLFKFQQENLLQSITVIFVHFFGISCVGMAVYYIINYFPVVLY